MSVCLNRNGMSNTNGNINHFSSVQGFWVKERFVCVSDISFLFQQSDVPHFNFPCSVSTIFWQKFHSNRFLIPFCSKKKSIGMKPKNCVTKHNVFFSLRFVEIYFFHVGRHKTTSCVVSHRLCFWFGSVSKIALPLRGSLWSLFFFRNANRVYQSVRLSLFSNNFSYIFT